MRVLGPEASYLVAAAPIACYNQEGIDRYAALEYHPGSVAWVKAELMAAYAVPRRVRTPGRLRRWFARFLRARLALAARDA